MGFMYRNAEWLSDEAAKKKLTEQSTQINSLSKRVKELKEENKKLTKELHTANMCINSIASENTKIKDLISNIAKDNEKNYFLGFHDCEREVLNLISNLIRCNIKPHYPFKQDDK